MADTANVQMDGTWISVAPAGFVTITSHGADLEWAEAASAPSEDLRGHIARAGDDRAFEITSGKQLYLRSGYGPTVTVTTVPA